MGEPFAPQIERIDPGCDAAWPRGIAPGLRQYLTALAGNGPGRLAENAKGIEGELVRVGDAVLPVLISDGAPGKASILSPMGHHLRYPVEEIGRRSTPAIRAALAILTAPLAILFRAGALDRVALVNHWLLSGAPTPDVAPNAWPPLLDDLKARHPNHAIVVQDVKPALEPELAAALQECGAIAVPTRQVHIVDPSRNLAGKRFKKMRHKQSQGQKALDAARVDLLERQVTADQCERLARLYIQSNIAQHSALNPDYAPAFFEAALACDHFKIHAWRAPESDNDIVAAFNLQRADQATIHWSTFGADPSSDKDRTYYQRITAADLSEAQSRDLLLDWGAGADEYKRLRGGVGHLQVEMVVVSHLPFHRQAVWRLLSWLRTRRAQQLGWL